jgi:hypothetical protein
VATVWIVNEAGHPYDDAKRFGELRALTRGHVNTLRVDRVMYDLAIGIGRYASEEDYLLISGTPMLNALALALWMIRFKEAKILQWYASQKKYQLNTISEGHCAELLERALVTV